MDTKLLVIGILVAFALTFDFTNGFHDTANAMATSIATRALPPRVAVILSGALNFVGACLGLTVAATIATRIVDNKVVTTMTGFAGLLFSVPEIGRASTSDIARRYNR